MLIGEVAAKYSVPIDTLRYYDRVGLLCPKRQGGQRRYCEQDQSRLESILKLRSLMFSLEEIKDLLSLDEQVDQGAARGFIDKESALALQKLIEFKREDVTRVEEKVKQVKLYLEHLLAKIGGVLHE